MTNGRAIPAANLNLRAVARSFRLPFSSHAAQAAFLTTGGPVVSVVSGVICSSFPCDIVSNESGSSPNRLADASQTPDQIEMAPAETTTAGLHKELKCSFKGVPRSHGSEIDRFAARAAIREEPPEDGMHHESAAHGHSADVEGNKRAIPEPLARDRCDNLAFLRFLLGGAGNDNAMARSFLFIDSLYHNAVIERPNVHDVVVFV